MNSETGSSRAPFKTSSDLRIVSVVGSDLDVVTLAEAKNYLRIDNTADDANITEAISAAVNSVERYLNSDITSKQREVFYTYIDEDINLYYAPVDASTIVLKLDDVTQILDEVYEINGLDDPKIRIFTSANKVSITFTTLGRTDAGIKQAVKAYVAYLYYGRDAKMSTNWKAFASPFRRFGFMGVR